MEGIKYVNLIEIDPVVIEIQGVEYGELAVPVNNTLVHHMAFLAADTQSCVLINWQKNLVNCCNSPNLPVFYCHFFTVQYLIFYYHKII